MKTLVHADTRKPVRSGEQLQSFRGEHYTLVDVAYPRHAGSSTGRVYVTADGETVQSYYPSAFRLEWIEQ